MLRISPYIHPVKNTPPLQICSRPEEGFGLSDEVAYLQKLSQEMVLQLNYLMDDYWNVCSSLSWGEKIYDIKPVSTTSAAAALISKGRWMTHTSQELLTLIGTQELKYLSLVTLNKGRAKDCICPRRSLTWSRTRARAHMKGAGRFGEMAPYGKAFFNIR